MIGRLKKISRIDADNRDMKGAICYIDGQVYTDITHSQCINKYLEKNKNTSLNDPYTRSLAYEDTEYDEYDVSLEDIEDIETIAENINQLGFAHKVSEENAIYIEQNTLQNVDINTVANAIKEKYPNYAIYTNEEITKDCIKIAKSKKAWLSETDSDRKFAILYINGEIYTGYTHYDCITKYKEDNNLDPLDNNFNMAFAYMASNNHVYLSDQNPGYDLSDLSMIAHAIKLKFPDSNIYIDNNPNFDTNLNKEYEKIARLKRVAEDSSIVGPNGVLWNDNIWDTYDQSLIQDQKSNINREWSFEKEIDNPEWILQQN